MTRRITLWSPSTIAIVVMAVGLVIHEAAYYLTGGDDFPLTVLADGTRVFGMSHGGLDVLIIGLFTFAVLAAQERVQDRALRCDAARVYGSDG